MVHVNDLPIDVVLWGIFPHVHPIQLWCCRSVCRTWSMWITAYFRSVQRLDFDDEYSEYYLTADGLHQIVLSLCFLRVIQLDMCHRSVTQECLLSLAGKCHYLEVLSLSLCREMNDDVLKAIAENCPRIRALHLNRCFQVNVHSII